MEGSGNVLFEYSLNIAAERSLNIPFERSWNVPQEHSENIALERSKNPDIFLVLGTFLENFCIKFDRNEYEVICIYSIWNILYAIMNFNIHQSFVNYVINAMYRVS